jgi:hypothetical protein
MWAHNPFFILGVGPEATAVEIERQGQRLLAELELGLPTAQSFTTPFGPRPRNAELVRQAVSVMRDPAARYAHEPLARLQRGDLPASAPDARWTGGLRAVGAGGIIGKLDR